MMMVFSFILCVRIPTVWVLDLMFQTEHISGVGVKPVLPLASVLYAWETTVSRASSLLPCGTARERGGICIYALHEEQDAGRRRKARELWEEKLGRVSSVGSIRSETKP